jgi:hypothetical protein
MAASTEPLQWPLPATLLPFLSQASSFHGSQLCINVTALEGLWNLCSTVLNKPKQSISKFNGMLDAVGSLFTASTNDVYTFEMVLIVLGEFDIELDHNEWSVVKRVVSGACKVMEGCLISKSRPSNAFERP